jgi:oligopeptide transport system substrate-binding protein
LKRLFLRITGLILFLTSFLFISAACSSVKVSVSPITVSADKVSTGSTVTLAVNVLSYENKTINYSVVFKINNSVKETKKISLAASETQTVSFDYIAAELGTYNAEINGVKTSFQVVKPAEFSVTGIKFDPEVIATGKDASVVAEVRNSGELPGTYKAVLNVDDTELTSKEVEIEAGGSASVSLPFKIETNGNHTFKVGGATKDVKVYKAAQLEASSLNITPSSIYTGQSVSVEVKITNTGELAGTMPVAVLVNGSEADSKSVTLEPGASQTVDFSLKPKTSGSQTIKILDASGSLSVTALKQYSSTYFGYKFSYPPDFELDSSVQSNVYFSTGNNIICKILSNNEAIDAPPKTLLDTLFEISTSTYTNWNNSIPKEILENNVTIGYSFDYSYIDNGKQTIGRALLIKKGGLYFTVDFFTDSSDWEKYKDLASLCLGSFITPSVFTGSYSNTQSGISLVLPSEWSLAEINASNNVFNLYSPYNKPFVLGMMVRESVPSGTTAQQYISIVKNGFVANGFQAISENAFTFSSGESGYECIVSMSSISERLITLVVDNKAYSFLFIGASSAVSSESNEITQLVKTISVTSTSIKASYDKNETLFLLGGEIPTLDPAIIEESPGDVVGALFSGLVKTDKDLKIVPDIADHWTVSEDGKTYSFYLRSNAKFHDGRQVTAADFKYAWERACNPATKSTKAGSFLNDIVGAREMMEGKATSISGIKVVDATTLEVTLDAAKVYFLGKISQPVAYVVDKANIEKGSDWYEQPNGTGPFKLKEWIEDERLVLEKNDNYYNTPAKLKNIVIQLYAGDPMTLYENGEIDIADVYTSNLDKVLDVTNPLNKDLETVNGVDTFFVWLNTNQPPFDDPKVRQAFALSLDVNKIIDVAMKGQVERAGGYVPPGIPGYNDSLQPMSQNVAQAKQLIAESKYKSVDQLPAITMYVPYGVSAVDQAMISMWQQNLGVQVNVQVISSLEDYLNRFYNHEFQVVLWSWRADYIDPQDFLDVLFQSQSPENGMGYSNPAVDAALAEAGAEKDETARLKMYQEIEQLILADLPAIPMYQNLKSYVLVKSYVKGYVVTPIGINLWNEIYVASH